MIRRKALLIGAPDISSANELPGVQYDLKLAKKHLISIEGGGWREDEVDILINQRWSDIRVEINRSHFYDYCLVIFSGHGAELVHSNFRKETIIAIDDDIEIKSDELRPKSTKGCLIIDSCRMPQLLTESERIDLQGFRKAAYDERAKLNESRFIFDDIISRSNPGILYIKGCSFNQSVDDDSSFTRNLIRFAKEGIHDLDNYHYCSIVNGFESIKGLNPIQTPEIVWPTSNQQRHQITYPLMIKIPLL